MKTKTRNSPLIVTIAGLVMTVAASGQTTIAQDFESAIAPDLPSGWTTVGVGDNGAYATTASTGNPGQSGNLDWTGSNTTVPSVYLVNDGVGFDTARPISGSFDFYVIEEGNYSNANFVIGDVQDGLAGNSGEFINVWMCEQQFGTRARVYDGSTSLLFNGDGNNSYAFRTNEWVSASFTWTPTSGTTGTFSILLNSPSFTNSPMVVTNYTFDGQSAFFGFGTGRSAVRFDNINITGTPFIGTYWDTNSATPGAGNPANGIWDGSITNWNSAADGTAATAAWTPGGLAVFAAGDDAADPYTVTVSGVQDISGLIFEKGAPTVTGGTLRLTADSYTIVKPGLSATVASDITDDGGNRSVATGGEGILILSGDNSGAVTSSMSIGGITQFNTPNSILGSGENLTINPGGILSFGGSFDGPTIQTALNDRILSTSAGTIAVDGQDAVDFDFATAGLSAAYLGAISDITYVGLYTPEGSTYRLGGGTGKLSLSNTTGMDEASPAIDVLGEAEISGNISGFTGTLTKLGSGTLTLSGANSYSAVTTASGGILKLTGSNSQATQTTINAATVQLASSSNGGLAGGQLTLNNNSAVLEAVGDDRSVANDVLLNSSPTISGLQSLTIHGVLTSNNNRQLNNLIASGKSLTLAGQINLSNNDTGRTLTLRSGATSGDAGVGKTFISGNIVDGGAGAGGLTLDSGWRDSQSFYLSGTNTYTGLTEIKNGLATFQGIQALSPGTTVRLNHTSGSNGQIALLDDGSGNIILPNTFQAYTNNSTGSHSIFVGNNNTTNGGISSGTTSGSTFVIPAFEFNFIKSDTQYSSVNITGADDYSLRIDAVTLNNANSRSAGQSWQARFNPTSASVSLGTVTMAEGNALKGIPFLQLEGSASGNVISGTISEASDALTTGRPLNLNKSGSSEWTLEGANTYTGATTITGGLLVVNGSLDPASAVAVNGGTLGGSGTIGGSVTVAAAGSLAPGAAVGTLTISGALDISELAGGAGLLDFEVGPIGASDQIAVAGTLTIGNDSLGLSDFNLSELAGLENGTYVIINSAGISGTLDPADVDGTLGLATIKLQTSGDNLVLAVSGLAGGSPYGTWSGGAAFNGDANGDGISNGLAFMLGAADPNADARSLLPTVTETAGGLVMTFTMRDSASRGKATLHVEHSSDLGISDAWTAVAVPDSSGGPSNGVTFAVSGSGTLDVTATIDSGEAAGGKLFGRLKASE